MTSEGKPLTKRVRTSSSEVEMAVVSVATATEAAAEAWDSRLGSCGKDMTEGEWLLESSGKTTLQKMERIRMRWGDK